MYYVEAGGGDPVVLLHGMGGDSRTWDLVRPRLAGNYRVFVPELPGHGRSPKPRGAYDADFYTGYLVRWLETLGVGPVHLVGHSLGGAIAVNLALARPDLVRSLGAVSSVRLVDHRPPGPVLRTFARFGLAQLFGPPSARATRRFLERGFGVAPRLLTPELIAVCQEAAGLSRRAVLKTNRVLQRPGSVLYDRLDKLHCPVWLAWGTHDPLFPGREKVAEVARRVSQATLDLMDCGHLPMFELPEAFGDQLEAHLKRARG